MRKIPRALTGLALPALAVGLSLSGLGRGAAQDPALFRSSPPAAPQGFAPAAGPGAGEVPAAPGQRPVRAPGPYEVTPQAGPWMVLAATYTCPDAVYLAEQVVGYLRERRWNAYIWNFADQKRRQEEEEFNRRMQNNPNVPYRRRFTRIPEECGVLVGGYPSMDAAKAALKSIKKLPPPDVRLRTGEEACDTIIIHAPTDGPDGPGAPERSLGVRDLNRVKISPFMRAFVIHNPALPRQEVDQTAKVDPLWKKLNAGEEYSLLRCKKEWTLVIKFYEGSGALQSAGAQDSGGGFLEKLGFGNKSKNILDATALQAHELARFLRQYKDPVTGQTLKAYVLHTRHGSIVTVGGYDAPGDAEMQAMQQKLSGLRLYSVGGSPVGNSHELFAQPMPMRVPRL
jgi:hypothetical protein